MGDSCIDYVDNGNFFRQPVKILYYLMSIITLALPYTTLKTMIDIWDYIDGKTIFMDILLTIVGLFIAVCSFYLWVKRAKGLKLDAGENSRFIAMPIIANLLQTIGEWMFIVIGIGGGLSSLIAGIFGGYSELAELGFAGVVVMPIAGYLCCLTMRFVAESTMALAHIANNTSAISNKLDK